MLQVFNFNRLDAPLRQGYLPQLVILRCTPIAFSCLFPVLRGVFHCCSMFNSILYILQYNSFSFMDVVLDNSLRHSPRGFQRLGGEGIPAAFFLVFPAADEREFHVNPFPHSTAPTHKRASVSPVNNVNVKATPAATYAACGGGITAGYMPRTKPRILLGVGEDFGDSPIGKPRRARTKERRWYSGWKGYKPLYIIPDSPHSSMCFVLFAVAVKHPIPKTPY